MRNNVGAPIRVSIGNLQRVWRVKQEGHVRLRQKTALGMYSKEVTQKGEVHLPPMQKHPTLC